MIAPKVHRRQGKVEPTFTRQPTSLAAARLAPERAQVLWLGYIDAQTRRRTRDSLFAAFQAWSVIERARPLPF